MPWTPKSYEQRLREQQGSASDAVYNARRRADPTSTSAMVERWRRSTRWQRLRERILTRDPLCRHCKVDGRVVEAVAVDHVVGALVDPGLFWREDNLQGLCAACHAAKSRRERAGKAEPERYTNVSTTKQAHAADPEGAVCTECGNDLAAEG